MVKLVRARRHILAGVHKEVEGRISLPLGCSPQLSGTTLAGVSFQRLVRSPVCDSHVHFECTYAGAVYTHSSTIPGIPTLRYGLAAAVACTSAELCLDQMLVCAAYEWPHFHQHLARLLCAFWQAG